MAKQFKPKTNGITVDEDTTVDGAVVGTAPETMEGVENPVETVENPAETETLKSDVEVTPDIVQKPAVKNVKILPKQNHTCCIGGTRYTLKKGVQMNVPVEVKTILNKAGLLMPL